VKLLNIFLILIVALTVAGQNPGSTASNGLIHTHTGRTLDQGMLQFKTNLNFFTKLGEILDQGSNSDNLNAANWWLVASNLSASYGFYNHFDFTASLRLYQDTHRDNEFNSPGDMFLSLKAGSFQFGRRKFNASFTTSFRIPLGEEHNYPFAEYASGALEYGFFGALSYYTDPYLPERSPNFHFNIGWWNHNELGEVLYTRNDSTELKATKNSSYLHLALASVIPTGEFEIRFELSGALATSKPDSFVYSSEEWVLLTPSVRYKPYDWVSVDLGVDLRMAPSNDRQWTEGVPDVSARLDLPKNYPPWKVQIGLNFNIPVGGKSAKTLEQIENEQFNQQVEFYRLIQDERDKSTEIEDELKELKRERQAADEEIEELKKMLDED
jgi:hypothetical protein